ncbi:MAG: DEAD/DEAH box helicase [Acidobacteriota bacterium]|nr:DEAD/DEAH box helicase [Acidobacteriota bacterium]
MYELTERGWHSANQDGWCKGKPVNEAFDQARMAFYLLKQGALHCARALSNALDLDTLKQEYQGLAEASFLGLLPQGPVADPLRSDLQQLGVLHLPAFADVPIPPTVQQVGETVFLAAHLTLSQRCRLYLDHREALPTLAADLEEELARYTIPVSQCRLRAPWLPRELVARYLKINLDDTGCFWAPETAYHVQWGLIAYLNRGKKERIEPSDEAIYEVSCTYFAGFANDWSDRNDRDLRLLIHAHYHLAHNGTLRLTQQMRCLPTRRQPHRWQTEDLSFALSGQVILNWDVGLGKTLGGIMAAMAHPGPALIAVPKSVLAKWYREITTCFPKAGVTVLGYKPKPGKNRFPTDKTALNEQAGHAFYGDNDIILTTHQVVTRISISPLAKALADEKAAIDTYGQAETRTAKRRSELFIQRAAERDFREEGTEFTWTDLPLASMLLVIDEAHRFRSLYPMPTSGWSDRLILSGSSSTSKCARDMLIKCDLLRQAGGKTLALTATPVTNSVADAFAMLRIFAPDGLRERRLWNIQQFIDQYCELEDKTSFSPTGNLMCGKAIVGFTNATDLKRIWSRAMITRTAAGENLPIPKPIETIVEVAQTPGIAAFLQEQRQRLTEAIRESKPDHIFRIMAQIHKLASFPPMVDLGENPKAEEVLCRVNRFYADGNQIIFTDLTEAQEGMRQLLIAGGIPGKEIAVVDGKVSVDKRLAIQDAYNEGKIRIVIGGAAASEGIDLQVNTAAIHHIALPWEGQTVHQRNGRGVRQGNQRDAVQVFYYLLEGSTDTYRLATINTKTTWWNALRAAQTDQVRENIFADPVPDRMIAALADNPEEAFNILQGQRRRREEQAEYATYLSVFRTMAGFIGSRQSNEQILASLTARVRKLRWIPQAVIEEALLRVRFGQVMLTRYRNEAFHDSTFYLAYRVKWEHQFLLTESDGKVAFRDERSALYKEGYLGDFSGLKVTFDTIEERTPPVDEPNPKSEPAVQDTPIKTEADLEEKPVEPEPAAQQKQKIAAVLSPTKVKRERERSWPKNPVQLSLFG